MKYLTYPAVCIYIPHTPHFLPLLTAAPFFGNVESFIALPFAKKFLIAAGVLELSPDRAAAMELRMRGLEGMFSFVLFFEGWDFVASFALLVLVGLLLALVEEGEGALRCLCLDLDGIMTFFFEFVGLAFIAMLVLTFGFPFAFVLMLVVATFPPAARRTFETAFATPAFNAAFAFAGVGILRLLFRREVDDSSRAVVRFLFFLLSAAVAFLSFASRDLCESFGFGPSMPRHVSAPQRHSCTFFDEYGSKL